ncbi:MAG: diguanylate cyclase [Verrucomicrobia bacterium]|nr:diguanylate cyclase [Verrucomicrobiota bacterium]
MQDSSSMPVALVVSGDSYKSAFFKRTLKGLFYVIGANDSFTAVDWLKSVHASLVIIDEKSLATTWPILADHIRKLSGYREIPLLLITNNLKKNFLVQAMNMGISDFINEPFDADEIFQRILVSTQSKPVTKKVTMLTKKFKKNHVAIPRKLSLPQRFVITEDAIKEIATVQKKHQSLCLLLIEVDDFKKMVDEIAHGEEKLGKYIEQNLKGHCRNLDVILPQGGGRFLMMLPNTSHRAAMAIAETVREAFQKSKFQDKGRSFSVSLCIGLVSLDKHSALSKTAYDQFDSLLVKVDKALGKAKHKVKKIA